jgi:hypothetical protein
MAFDESARKIPRRCGGRYSRNLARLLPNAAARSNIAHFLGKVITVFFKENARLDYSSCT